MEIGNFCSDPPGTNPQCEDEERAHFGLWCIMSSPLVLVRAQLWSLTRAIADSCSLVPVATVTCLSKMDSQGFNMSNSLIMDRVWPTITNREAIAVDHAWAGSPGMLYKTLHNDTVEVWAKPLPQQAVAVLILNTAVQNISLEVSVANDLPPTAAGATSYRSIWTHEDIPITNGKMLLKLTAHDNVFAVLNNSGAVGWE